MRGRGAPAIRYNRDPPLEQAADFAADSSWHRDLRGSRRAGAMDYEETSVGGPFAQDGSGGEREVARAPRTACWVSQRLQLQRM